MTENIGTQGTMKCWKKVIKTGLCFEGREIFPTFALQ